MSSSEERPRMTLKLVSGSLGVLEGVSLSPSNADRRAGGESKDERGSSHDLGVTRLSIEVPLTSQGSEHARPSSHGSEFGYGWFDYDDQLSLMEGANNNQADHMSVLNRIESLRELDLSARADVLSTAKRKLVLFNLSQKNFTVTTKVFEDVMTGRSYFLALGLGGFRIVQNTAGQHAEFNLIVCMNSQTYCIWKRYNHFVTLMNNARESHHPSHLQRTLLAWANLEKRRKWYRCLDVKYLAQKYSLLEVFLKELVYEIKSPALLIKFASGKTDDSK